MKFRKEPLGLHLYDRNSGYHILLDEIKFKDEEFSVVPRTVSIAITDKCDLNCTNCYIEKNNNFLSKEEILKWCNELDSLGTLDIAIGGGEPTIHPDLIQICKQIWETTNLGLSITTHGYNLTYEMIDRLKDILSIIRILIDGNESSHFIRRKRKIEDLSTKLAYLRGKIKFGLNFLINTDTISSLDSYLQFSIDVGAEEILLLPMIVNDKPSLTKEEWEILDIWIKNNYIKIPLRISNQAKSFLTCPFLFHDEYGENSYAYISADKKWKRNSFVKEGIEINKYDSLIKLLKQN